MPGAAQLQLVPSENQGADPMVLIVQFQPGTLKRVLGRLSSLEEVKIINHATDAVVIAIHGEQARCQRVAFAVAGWPEVGELTVLAAAAAPLVIRGRRRHRIPSGLR